MARIFVSASLLSFSFLRTEYNFLFVSIVSFIASSFLTVGGYFATRDRKAFIKEFQEKAQRIKSWTVSDAHPQGDIKEAEAILAIWSNDLCMLANNLKKQSNIPVPGFHERPILQLGRYGFQLPWLMATQNNSMAAINNLRRIGCRRGGRKNETLRIEHRLGEIFEIKGFAVVKAYQPIKTLKDDPGELL